MQIANCKMQNEKVGGDWSWVVGCWLRVAYRGLQIEDRGSRIQYW